MAQDFIFPKYQIKGEVVKIYETTIQVFLRTDTWAFEKREFQFGEIIELDEIRQYQAIYQYYDVNQLLSNFQFSTLLDGRLAMGKFYVDDELSSSVDFAYNSSGQISSAVFTYEKAKKASKCYEYEYHDGELIQTKMTILFRDTFEVNYRIVNGNISETIKKNNSGQIALKSKYEYNKEGYPSKIEFFEKDGKLKNRKTYIYQYDEKANWTKRLETDSKRDVRTLTQRVLVYKDNLKTKKISKKELIGSWKGWSEEIFIDFKENTAEVAIKKERLVHAYQYDSYFGALLLKTKDFERPKSYLTEFDGKILTLNQQNNENVFFLKKINLNNFDSPKEKDFFYYFQRKPKAKVFRSNNKFGLKSKTGKVLITPQYESVSPISPQAVKVEKEGKYTLFDYYGKQLASSFYDDIVLRKLGYFRFKKNGKVGLLNPLGKEIIPAIYTKIDLMKDGYVKIFDGLRQGVATIDNRILLPAKYYRIKPVRFNRSFAASSAFIKPADWVNGEYQLVRRFDNYLQVYPMDVNCFKVRNGEYWGLIDSLGNDILLPKYESLQIASAQLIIAEKNKKYGLINTLGDKITDIVYDKIITTYKDGYAFGIYLDLFKYGAAAMFMRDNEFGFLDGLGTEIAPKPTLNKQERLYKKYTVPGILELTYPTLWQKNGNTINYRNERASLTIQYKHYSYSNDVKKWIKTKTQESDLKTMWIDGKEAFYFVKKKGVGYNAVYWTQNIYLPISSSTMVVLEISCSDFFYPKNAQDIYDVVHSIRILK